MGVNKGDLRSPTGPLGLLVGDRSECGPSLVGDTGYVTFRLYFRDSSSSFCPLRTLSLDAWLAISWKFGLYCASTSDWLFSSNFPVLKRRSDGVHWVTNFSSLDDLFLTSTGNDSDCVDALLPGVTLCFCKCKTIWSLDIRRKLHVNTSQILLKQLYCVAYKTLHVIVIHLFVNGSVLHRWQPFRMNLAA